MKVRAGVFQFNFLATGWTVCRLCLLFLFNFSSGFEGNGDYCTPLGVDFVSAVVLYCVENGDLVSIDKFLCYGERTTLVVNRVSCLKSSLCPAVETV